jgi:nickel/cobalt transporter (NicO) family protein
MSDFDALLQQGNAWLFLPSAVLLGALHGLEPGHSKTMMAAFIVAIRGTALQAALLGLAATVSHTALVWIIALGGLYFGRQWNTEVTEPYLQLVSGVLIVAIALWMLLRRFRTAAQARNHDHDHDRTHGHSHAHGHDHTHGHEDQESAPAHVIERRIDTGHGALRVQISAQGAPARFRIYDESGATWPADSVQVETERADGSREVFTFRRHGDCLESAQVISEPYEFLARLRLVHGGHRHDYDTEFVEHSHRHAIGALAPLDLTAPGYQDPHELAHANDIRRRFVAGEVSTSQIVAFGLTGGLIPCAASVTVLLICLQLRKVALGALLVLAFSVGLALTLVASGVIAALGVRYAAGRFAGFSELARRAPYLSGLLILAVGLYVSYRGISALG